MALIRRRPSPGVIISKPVALPAPTALRRGPLKAKPVEELKKIKEEIAPLPEGETHHFAYLDVIERYARKVRNPMTAIRAKCVDCSGGSLTEVRECRVNNCVLWPFRNGDNPMNKKVAARLAAQNENGEHDGAEEEGEEE